MMQLGAGVIGLGVGEQHAHGFQRASSCDVVSICDLSPEQLGRVSRHFPQARGTTRWRELIDDPNVHVVSIASFDDAHCEQTLAALEADKHVFIEKPLCRTRDELERIKTRFDARHVPQLGSNLVLRAAPVYRWLKDEIAEGRLGEIYAIDGDYLYGRIHKITDGWRKDVESYSVMLGGGIHLADLMLWLTGQKPVSVSATGNRICTRGSRFQQHDFVAARFQFDSGLVGRITANFGCVHRHQHVLRVFGTKATFLLDDAGPRLITTRDPAAPPRKIDLPTLPAAKWDLIPDFLDSILHSGDRVGRAQQEFDTLSVCLAADESLAAGEVKGIPYV